ncbi:HNH endonuclease, partial [Escherichia coli]
MTRSYPVFFLSKPRVAGLFIGASMPPRTPKACRVRGCRQTTTDP